MYTKKRVRQHIMEDRSMQIVRELLPEQWVIREYRPDYGIDLLIELFEYIDDERSIAATLGETLFVQVKSAEVVDAARLRVHSRANVELAPLHESQGKSTEIEVARLRLETSELLTVQAIGAAIPVLLFLVELSTRRVYYVCLNDLVEKVVIPEDPLFSEKKSKRIHVPLRNCVSLDVPGSHRPLETYAKRAKLYAAFSKFAYQRNELGHALAAYRETSDGEGAHAIFDLVRHFLSIIRRYDFWTRIPEWPPISWAYKELSALSEFLETPDVETNLPALHDYLLTEPAMKRNRDWVRSLEMAEARADVLAHIGQIWDRLANLGRIYEEVGREWFLPTDISVSHVRI